MKVKIGKYPKKGNNRKISVEIERFDTFSLDHTLALIILPALIQLKSEKAGIPGDFAEVGGEDWIDQQCFDFYSETQKESFDKRVEQWEEILDKMIWAFQQLALENYEDRYHHGHPKYDWVLTGDTMLNPITNKQEKLYQIVDKNPDKHWYDSEGHKLHEERIQEGLELFGKYYRNLWD